MAAPCLATALDDDRVAVLTGHTIRRQIVASLFLLLLFAGCEPGDGSATTEDPGTVSSCEDLADPELAVAMPTFATFTDETVLEWDTATPDQVGLDPEALGAIVDDLSVSNDVKSLLIARHGRLALERYFNGGSAGEAANLYSLTKSVVSLLAGVAVDDGVLSTDTRIGDVLDEGLVGEHGDVEVVDLLTMGTGVGGPELDLDYDSEDPNLVRTALSYPAVAEPNTVFHYNSGISHVLAAVVTEATGQSLCDLAVARLFGPMGIDVDFWSFEPDGNFTGPTGLFLTPREVARIGQLVLQRGRWEGGQLISPEWLDASMEERWDLGCRFPTHHKGYGLHWWTENIAGHDVWNASGRAGQELLIVPDLDLVVVVTHDTDDRHDHQQVGIGPLIHAILQAVVGYEPVPSDCTEQTFVTWRVDVDGTGRVQMADWPLGAVAWSVSPDGQWLALTSSLPDLNDEIYTIGLDGSGFTRLTRDFATEVQPAWSPDGQWVAFVRGAPGESDLYVTRPDGSETRRVTDFPGFEQFPTWSPDGTRLAFIRGSDAKAYGVTGELWTIGVDGADAAVLHAGPVATPMWSPDGARILIETGTFPEPGRIGYLDLATGEVVELGPGALPRWSPDGSRIAYVVIEGADDLDVFVMDADGGNVRNVTDDDGWSTVPVWLGNDQLLFVSRPPGD